MSTTAATTALRPRRQVPPRSVAALLAAMGLAAGIGAGALTGGDGPGAVPPAGGSGGPAGFSRSAAGALAPTAALDARAEVDGGGLRLRRGSHDLVALRTASVGRPAAQARVRRGRVTVAGGMAEVRRDGLVERYRTTVGGIEQSWAIGRRPAGPGPLVVGVRVRGLRATASSPGSVLLRHPGQGSALAYGGLVVHDADGRRLPAHLEAHPHAVGIVVDDRGARYPLDIDPTLSATLTDPDGAAGALTGSYVAQSDDASVVVATGATSRLDVWTRAGAGYAHRTLAVPGATSYSNYPVAVSGDGQVLVVVTTAFTSTGSGSSQARSTAHVYTGGPTQWGAQTPIDATPVATLVLYAHLSADGSTLEMGTYPQDTIDRHIDVAFSGPPASWATQTPVELDGTLQGNAALAADGRTLAVGAPFERQVRVYTGEPSSWPAQAPRVVRVPDPPSGTYVVGLDGEVSMTSDAQVLVVRRELQGATASDRATQVLAYAGGPGAWAAQAPTVLTLPAAYGAGSVAVGGACPVLLAGVTARDGTSTGALAYTGPPSTWPAQQPAVLALPGTGPVTLGPGGLGAVGEPATSVGGHAQQGQVAVVDVGAASCPTGPGATTPTTATTVSPAGPGATQTTTTTTPGDPTPPSTTSTSAPTSSVAASAPVGPPVVPPAGVPPAATRPAATATTAAPSTSTPTPGRAVVARMLGLPSPKRCLSRRVIPITLRDHLELGSASVRVVRATLALDGRTVARVRGARRVILSLRGKRKARYRVTITATTSTGRTLRGSATYRTCARRSRR